MGTDIHAMFQVRRETGWEDLPFVPGRYADKFPWSKTQTPGWDGDRQYLLFAWLANVRNGHGFAGVYTHEPIVPLSDRIGFPEDFTLNGDPEEDPGQEYRRHRGET